MRDGIPQYSSRCIRTNREVKSTNCDEASSTSWTDWIILTSYQLMLVGRTEVKDQFDQNLTFCLTNLLYSFWALWWWVYLQGCLRTPFYHPINVGFMPAKHLGGFKRHFIESKVLPRLQMAASHALQLLPKLYPSFCHEKKCFLEENIWSNFYQIGE